MLSCFVTLFSDSDILQESSAAACRGGDAVRAETVVHRPLTPPDACDATGPNSARLRDFADRAPGAPEGRTAGPGGAVRRIAGMVPRRLGRFVVLEGADGCGKSTQARRLASHLLSQGREVLHLRDPGSTRLAEAVRAILLDPAVGHVAVEAEVSLYLAARAQLLAEVLAPALRRGADVVCERWTLSTEVYQGVAGGFGAPRVRRAAATLLPKVAPRLTLVLDVGVGQGLRRLQRDLDRMEGKGERFHASVVRAYRRLAARRSRTVLVPSGTPDEVAEAVRTHVEALRG